MPENKLRVILQAETSKFTNSLNKANKQLGGFSKRLTNVGKDLSLKLTLPIAAAGGAAIKLASDFEESLNKVDVSFKQSSNEVKEFTKTTLTQFGIAQGTALDMAAMFGDMGTSMGLTTQEAAKMSTSMVGLAGDLASFKNIKIEEATTALAAVFTGETESLKRLGIVMTEANLKQFALSQGIQTNIKDMTQAEKTTLRYQFVMASTANAQGDFARTQDGAANQMRIFTESLKELGVNIGQIILPAFTELVAGANKIVQGFIGLSDGAKKAILIIGSIAASIGPLLLGLGAIIKIAPLVGAGFTLMTGPIGIAIVAIGAIVAAVIYFRDELKGLGSFLKTKITNVFIGVIGFFQKLAAKVKGLGSIIGAALKFEFGKIPGILEETDKEVQSINEETGRKISENIAKGIKENTDAIAKGMQEAVDNAATTVEVPTLGGGETRKPVAAVSGITQTTGTQTATTQQMNLQAGSSLFGEMQTVALDPVGQLAQSVAGSNELLKERLGQTEAVISESQLRMVAVAQQFSEGASQILVQGVNDLAVGLGEALGEAMVNGGNMVESLSVVLLQGIGNMASQLGKLAIGTGIAIEGIKKALESLNPIAAIAAGIALVALGAAVKGAAGKIANKGGGGGVPAFANGGIVSGPTLGLMGEYAGAKSNPEVIAPLDRLQNMIGDRQPQQVNVGGEFSLRGQDLIVALQRAEKFRGRIK